LRKSGIAKLISKRLEFALALLESSAPKSQTNKRKSEEHRAAVPSTAASANLMLFTGCVGEGLFARVNQATVRVLEVNGFPVQTPPQQVCCGALHAHAGDLEGARTLARRNIMAFETNSDAPVITNAGGCGAMLASYGHLLVEDEAFAERARSFSARVRDVGQQLETVVTKTAADVTGLPATYDSSCHLLYGQHAADASLKMMGAVVAQDFVKLEGSDRCCGGAGIYNLLEPDLSQQVLGEKLAEIRKTGAKVLASGNPGCQMQIGAGALLAEMDLIVCHPVELLDEAYARAGMYRSHE
jgi:glycolate oxidase iron-sulfur subunit